MALKRHDHWGVNLKPHRPRFGHFLTWVVLSAFVCATHRPARADDSPSPAAPIDATTERLAQLRTLLGPGIDIRRFEDNTFAEVRLRIDRFEQNTFDLFTPIAGQWTIGDDGIVRAKALGVCQWMCLVPWAPEDLQVRGRLQASGITELNFYDPWSPRFTGSESVGRLHLGRLSDIGGTDWFEVSRRDMREASIQGLHFVDGPQEVELSLRDGQLRGSVKSQEGIQEMEKVVVQGDPPPHVYFGVGSGVLNTVQIDRLHILGRVNLFSSTLCALVGQGREFWNGGRDVRLYFNAGGTVRRLLINGVNVPETNMTTQPIESAKQLRQVDVRLNWGDVLAVELLDADDEAAFFLVGVDLETKRSVLATHPLTWVVAPSKVGKAWLRTPPAKDLRPRVGSGGYDAVQLAIIRAIGERMPGLPIAGPQARTARVHFKCLVR